MAPCDSSSLLLAPGSSATSLKFIAIDSLHIYAYSIYTRKSFSIIFYIRGLFPCRFFGESVSALWVAADYCRYFFFIFLPFRSFLRKKMHKLNGCFRGICADELTFRRENP